MAHAVRFMLLVAFASSVAFAVRADDEKVRADCSFKGQKLFGKVQIVTAFPDFKVQVVESFPDLRVQHVDAFPDQCGKWQLVEAFPDFKIQYVDAFPDFKVQRVESFPGLP